MIDNVKIIECPRDAMQSIKKFIPTDLKISYLQSVVNVNFDILFYIFYSINYNLVFQLYEPS